MLNFHHIPDLCQEIIHERTAEGVHEQSLRNLLPSPGNSPLSALWYRTINRMARTMIQAGLRLRCYARRRSSALSGLGQF